MRTKKIAFILSIAMMLTACQLQTIGKKEETKATTYSSVASNENESVPKSTIADVDLRDKEGADLVNAKMLNQKVEGEFVSYEEFKYMEKRQEITDGIWNMTGYLLEAMGKDTESPNRIISPMSLYTSLAALREGASGGTKDSLSQLMGVPNDLDISKEIYAFTRLFNTVKKDGQGNPTRDGIAMSSGIFIKNGAEINKGYLQKLTDFYLTESSQVDFNDAANTEKLVNAWIKERSRGFLDGNYKSNPENVVEIVDVLALNGMWYQSYEDKGTIEFTTEKGNKITVPAMGKKDVDSFAYKGDNYTAFYDQVKDVGTVWFILPDEGVTLKEINGYKDLISLDPSGMEHVRLNVTIPLLNLEGTGINIKNALGDTYKGFFEQGADFSGIASGLNISNISQRLKLSVDNAGIRAGNVNSTAMAGAVKIKDFEELVLNFNRPYIMVIEQYNVPHFIAFIGDPSAK